MRSLIVLAYSLILLSTVVIINCSSQSYQSLPEQPVEIPLHPYVGRLVTVEAVVASDTLRLILDTGGGETLIGPEVACALGCMPSGRHVGFRMSGEKVVFQYCSDVTLNIGGIPFKHETIAVWDIRKVLPEDLPPVDGILSLKTFHNQPFTLNLAAKSMIFESGRSLANRIEPMTRLNSRIATGPDGSALTVFLHGKIKKSGWFLLDSGNLDAVQVAPHLDHNTASDSTSSEVWESRFVLDHVQPVLTKFRTRNIIYDGALSEAFMRKWIFTFDLADNAVWAKPNEPLSSN